MDNNFKSALIYVVGKDAALHINQSLEDEERPHEVVVRKVEGGLRQVTIYCDTDNIEYFRGLWHE